MIFAIDPSFSSTGIALLDDDLTYIAGEHFGSAKIYDTFGAFYSAGQIIIDKIEKFLLDNDVLGADLRVIIETPALATSSGAYLGVLSGMLYQYFKRVRPAKFIYFVPCTACNSFIGNKVKTKSYIVDYCKSHKWIPEKRINNDICTAVVLAHVLDAINTGKYKNKFFSE